MSSNQPEHVLDEALQLRLDTAKVEEQEALARKAAAEASAKEAEIATSAAEARQAQWKGLIPDLSSVDRGELKAPDDKALVATILAYTAMRSAAAAVAKNLTPLPPDACVLVTSDPDLATDSATYREVKSAVYATLHHAENVLTLGAVDAPDEPGHLEVANAAAAAGAAVAGAIPGVLSLLSAHRSISVVPTEKNDLAAAAAVVGVAMKLANDDAGPKFVHDDFRVSPDGEAFAWIADLAAKRLQLADRKAEIGVAKTAADKAALDEKTALGLKQEKYDKLPREQQTAELLAELRALKLKAGEADLLAQNIATRATIIDAAISAIDTLSASLRSVPAGARRSLVAAASLYEQLHASPAANPRRFTHALLVKSEGGQVQQTTSDRALWFKDKVSSLAESAISYILIDTRDGTIMKAGTEARTAQARGSIGSALVIDPPLHS